MPRKSTVRIGGVRPANLDLWQAAVLVYHPPSAPCRMRATLRSAKEEEWRKERLTRGSVAWTCGNYLIGTCISSGNAQLLVMPHLHRVNDFEEAAGDAGDKALVFGIEALEALGFRFMGRRETKKRIGFEI